MDTIDLYKVSFEGCVTKSRAWDDKTVTLSESCAPLGANGTKTECASYFSFDRACNTYTITAEERIADGVKLQCFIECSVIIHSSSSAVTVYPTFVITFVALVFELLLSSKRSR